MMQKASLYPVKDNIETTVSQMLLILIRNICILILMLLIVTLIIRVVFGAFGMSMTDSGLMYNHLKDMI